jgi:glycosyltransferase involved in cell wall biosynthesis
LVDLTTPTRSLTSLDFQSSGLRGRCVIVLNWKDDQHPQAGGAEKYCHAVAERFVEQGAKVYLLTARAPGQARRETRGGVEIHRSGGTYSVYPLVLLRILLWRMVKPERVDLILDCQNGIPFFSPLVASRRTAIVGMVFHVHQDQFLLYFSPLAARFGRWLEGPVCRFVYRRRTFGVISPSTRRGVRDRLRLRGALFVAPCGSEQVVPVAAELRSSAPSIVCVGRLVPHKRVDLLLLALPAIISRHPHLHVQVIGDGPARSDLEALAGDLGVADHVTFHGHVSDAQRDALTSRGWLAVMSSVGEGWGLSIIEGNAAGLPAVCFNVDGLRDAVRHGDTGWIAALAEDLAVTVASALNILSDEAEAAIWSSRARAWAANFSWDATAATLGNVLLAESDRLALSVNRRQCNDLALHVTIEGESLDNVSGARRTDIWHEQEGVLVGLLYGLDERDLGIVLDRMGLGQPTTVRVARTNDLPLTPRSVDVSELRPSVIDCLEMAPLDLAQ